MAESGTLILKCTLIVPPIDQSETELDPVYHIRRTKSRSTTLKQVTEGYLLASVYPNRMPQGGDNHPLQSWASGYRDIADDLFHRDNAPYVAVKWFNEKPAIKGEARVMNVTADRAHKFMAEAVRQTSVDFARSVPKEGMVALLEELAANNDLSKLKNSRIASAESQWMRGSLTVLSELVAQRERSIAKAYAHLIAARADNNSATAYRLWKQISSYVD